MNSARKAVQAASRREVVFHSALVVDVGIVGDVLSSLAEDGRAMGGKNDTPRPIMIAAAISGRAASSFKTVFPGTADETLTPPGQQPLFLGRRRLHHRCPLGRRSRFG